MTLRSLFGCTLAVTSACALAQPARLMWSRNSSSPGLLMDGSVRGLVDSAGRFVIVGADTPLGQLPKGNITIFNRKTAAIQQIDITPPGNGPLGLTCIVEHDGIFYVAGVTRPVGSNSDEVYVGRFDGDLNLIGQATFQGNIYNGTEAVTDMKVDANGNIYLTGIAQKYNKWQLWVAKTDGTAEQFQTNFGKVDLNEITKPEITLNGIIAILIGFKSNEGLALRSYKPNGALNFNLGIVLERIDSYTLSDVLISGYSFVGASWTTEDQPGVFTSHASLYRINTQSGQVAGQYGYDPIQGFYKITFEDVIISSFAGQPVVNALLQRDGVASLFRHKIDLSVNSMWQENQTSSQSRIAAATPWGDVRVSLGRENSIECLRGLASNNATNFAINSPTYNLILPYMEQENLFHQGSGDILAIRTDGTKTQFNCYVQAPVAITDSYTAKSGVTFRPPAPITINDRYGEGSGITVSRQPEHGTLSVGSNGFFLYRSVNGFVGTDTFTYTLTKAGLKPSTATVNIVVRP